MKTAKIAQRYRVDRPHHFSLDDIDPADTGGLDLEKDDAKTILAEDVKLLTELQEKLYAEDRWAVLVILQGMDAAGKDSVIKHVMSGVNPQGCEVHSFKAPSSEELDHDFLWRAAARLPRRGRIGIFNRSYYEEVLVARVQRELLAKERLPERGNGIWKQRFESIEAFERHLVRNGTIVLKFHLRLSKKEQTRRFLQRLEDPSKQWKFSMSDVTDRSHWDGYMAAYEEMIRGTSTSLAPWYVVPADQKWFTRLVVAAAIIAALEGLNLKFPKVEGEALHEMKRIRQALLAEEHGAQR